LGGCLSRRGFFTLLGLADGFDCRLAALADFVCQFGGAFLGFLRQFVGADAGIGGELLGAVIGRGSLRRIGGRTTGLRRRQ
jgi:hypothetical protein